MRLLVLLLTLLVAAPQAGGGRRRAVAHPRRALIVDCVGGRCPQIDVIGDAPATGPARGFADPSIRRDGAVLWMAYSWPHLEFVQGGAVTAVDSHLARSDDGGVTWRFVKRLWSARRDDDGFVNNETVSLATDGERWYSVRLQYFTNAGGLRLSSFVLRIETARIPELLAGFEFVDDDVLDQLDDLHRDTAGCIFNDPALFFRDGRLFLATQCMRFQQGEERPELEFLAVFATTPTGPANAWTWRYLGKLAGHAEARELGGEMLQQTDLALAGNGDLLAIVSPATPSTPLSTHHGCRAVQIASLDPPTLARDAAGRLITRATVNVSDQPPFGPGACAYDAASATGMVIVRRQVQPELVVTMNASGLRP